MTDDASFGRIPTDVVRAGLFANLGKSELAVYLVIAGHVNGKTWSTTLRVATIADLAGVNPRTVQRATGSLAARKAITVQHGGGRTAEGEPRANTYTLTTNPDTQDDGVAYPDTQDVSDDKSERLPRQNRASTLTRHRRKSLSEQSRSPEQIEQTEQRRSAKTSDVERIYQDYPRKVGKTEALKAITKALSEIKRRPGVDDPVVWLLERVQRFAESPAGNRGKYTPHPATWFNQGRYDDDPAEWKRDEDRTPRPSMPEPRDPTDEELRMLFEEDAE